MDVGGGSGAPAWWQRSRGGDAQAAALSSSFRLALGEENPGLERWGAAASWKIRGSGRASLFRGLPNAGELKPWAKFHAVL